MRPSVKDLSLRKQQDEIPELDVLSEAQSVKFKGGHPLYHWIQARQQLSELTRGKFYKRIGSYRDIECWGAICVQGQATIRDRTVIAR